MNKLRIGDQVIVITGGNKGEKGEVLSLNWKKNRVLVKDVNLRKKTRKPSSDGQDPGGIFDVPCPMNMSNVAVFSQKTNKGSKIGFKIENGKKVRYLKACGTVL